MVGIAGKHFIKLAGALQCQLILILYAIAWKDGCDPTTFIIESLSNMFK